MSIFESTLKRDRDAQRTMNAMWLGMVDVINALHYQLYAIIADKHLMVQRAPHWKRS